VMLAYLTGVTFKEPNTFEVQLIMDGLPHRSLVLVAIDERSFPGHFIQVTKGERNVSCTWSSLIVFWCRGRHTKIVRNSYFLHFTLRLGDAPCWLN
jgi:hypothetical protein